MRIIITAREWEKYSWGSQSPNTSFPLAAKTRYPAAPRELHLSSVHAGYLSIRTHISGPESYLGTAPNTPSTCPSCCSYVATKSPYYEPSNLGPATIGIWHQIFISPLDTISVTSDRHGSPISPVHLSCSCQPPTMSSQKWQKTDRPGLGRKAKLGLLQIAFVSIVEGECWWWQPWWWLVWVYAQLLPRSHRVTRWNIAFALLHSPVKILIETASSFKPSALITQNWEHCDFSENSKTEIFYHSPPRIPAVGLFHNFKLFTFWCTTTGEVSTHF